MFEVTRDNLDGLASKLGQLRKFLDVPSGQRRLAELESQMASDSFWNNQEAARKVIDEANALRKKLGPQLEYERQVEDLKVLLELGEAEPPDGQAQVQREADGEVAKIQRGLDRFELGVLLTALLTLLRR